MRVVLFSSFTPTTGSVQGMRTLLDRPFVQHVIESLVQTDNRRIDVVSSRGFDSFQQLLGNGSRWGCRIRHHHSYEGLEAALVRPSATDKDDTAALIAVADRLPRFSQGSFQRNLKFQEVVPVLLPDGKSWSGWAGVNLRKLPIFISRLRTSPGQVARQLASIGSTRSITAKTILGCRTHAEWLEAHADALNGSFPGLLYSGRQCSPGVWIGRNAHVDPTARLRPPVYVGEGARVCANSEIGPFTVLGRYCWVETGTRLESVLVTPWTYVPTLRIHSAIADQDTLWSVGASDTSGDISRKGGTRSLQSRNSSDLAQALTRAWSRLIGDRGSRQRMSPSEAAR